MISFAPEVIDNERLWLREKLARLDQLQADSERKRQELILAPHWKTIIATIAAFSLLAGVLGYKIGATPTAPIVIQLKDHT